MAKKRLAALLALALGMTLSAGQAVGQGRGQGMGGLGMGQGGQRGGRVRENLATLRLLRLTQALDLTEDQTAKIFPVVNKIEKEKVEVQRRLGSDIQDLRRIVSGGDPTGAEIGSLIASIKAAQEKVKQLDAESEAFLEKNLTVVQQGRYVLFQIDFYRLLEQAVVGLKPQRGAAQAPIKK
jgi:Spy/CpxP family protein refolding chaperone